MLDPSGLKTAVAGAVRAGDGVPGAAAVEQLPLLCEVGTGQQAAEKSVPEPRGVGRPPGSSNKSTKEWQQFILSRYTSPLVGLAEIAGMDLKELGALLGIKDGLLTFEKALELLKVKVGCMNALAPYVHQKMPTAIDTGESGLIQLVINAGSSQRVEEAPPMQLEIIEIESVENQCVSDSEKQNSVAYNSVACCEDYEMTQQNAQKQTDLGSDGGARTC